MDNDKIFAIYACTLVAGIGSVITASVLGGAASVPDPVMFLEHLAMSVTFRAAYKSLAGPVWWPYPETATVHTLSPNDAIASSDDDLLDAA